MRFEILTIFPGFFAGIFENGILRRALAEGLVSVGVHDLRAFTHDRHRTVDDRPFGGGEGMVLKPEPLAEALASLGIQPKAERRAARQSAEKLDSEAQPLPPTPDSELQPRQGTTSSDSQPASLDSPSCQGSTDSELQPCPPTTESESQSCQGTTSVVPQLQQYERGALAPEENSSEKSSSAPAGQTRVILLSAQGRPFTQAMARELATVERVVLICGRYEGVDERINQLYCDQELSIGDYVLSGGELAAAVVVDATMRLIPGVLGNEASGEFESFGVADAEIATTEDGGAGGLLDYPHYTRPAEFGGLSVPATLLNGDHREIRRWRREQQLRKTLANRPDLLEGATLSQEDRKLLEVIRREVV
jgi:tRNA (guanine37-N1)-methyltransferase